MLTNRRPLLVPKRGYLTFWITFGLYWVLLGLPVVLKSLGKDNVKVEVKRYKVPSILHCLSRFPLITFEACISNLNLTLANINKQYIINVAH